MENIVKVESVGQYNAMFGQQTHHPLVSIVDYSKSPMQPYMLANMGIYAIFLKDVKCGDLRYGRKTYDYQEGTLVFIAPGQVIGVINEGETYQPQGWALLFHPDLIHGTPLGQRIKDYSFFSYEVSEALHLSEREHQIVMECLHKIDFELQHSIDKHSQTLIVANIELLLSYCVRFYDRQFLTRHKVNNDLLEKFERLLDDYFQTDKPQTIGLPSVQYCADQLFLSTNYFGDLIKKETGKSPQEHIQTRLIDIAKERIFDKSKSVSEIAYELGFKYPQNFSRLFKQMVGQSPNEYRTLN